MVYKFKTSKKRSELMKKIKSNNTSPEIYLRRKLWGKGFRFSRRESGLPGKPDIVLRRFKIAIFIDGEFWHGYNWKEKKKTIRSNRDYWVPKIERNIARDKKYTSMLRRSGWQVIRFWQNAINKDLDKCALRVQKEVEKRKLKMS